MPKLYLLIIFLTSISTFAQTKVTPQKQTPVPSSYIGKTWKIFSVEEFGVVSKPKPKAATDMLQLKADNTFILRVDSVDVSGKYTRSGKSLILKNEAQQAYYVTILKDKTDTLVIQCKNPDYILSTYTYIKQ